MKRYSIYTDNELHKYDVKAVENASGDWVKFEDVQELLNKMHQLSQLIDDFEDDYLNDDIDKETVAESLHNNIRFLKDA